MVADDKLFAGSIPEVYDRLLVPLIFEPYARDWGDWSAFRGRDQYVTPALAFPHLVANSLAGACEVQGRTFQLSDAIPVMPSFPSMALLAPIPEPGARLSLRGHSQVFLEYDPLSSSLSPRMAANHITQQIDNRHGQLRMSFVPLAGVRGAWLVQAGEIFWCRVFAQQENGSLLGTAGRAFGYDRHFGWVVKEGPPANTDQSAVEMRAERAAFYHVLGLAAQVEQNAGWLSEIPGSRYLRLGLSEGPPA